MAWKLNFSSQHILDDNDIYMYSSKHIWHSKSSQILTKKISRWFVMLPSSFWMFSMDKEKILFYITFMWTYKNITVLENYRAMDASYVEW